MKSNQNKQVVYVNVCQYCGSEKELKPVKRLGSIYHVCRDCEIKAIKAQVGK